MRLYEKICFFIGLGFLVFCLTALLYGETAALWTARITLACAGVAATGRAGVQLWIHMKSGIRREEIVYRQQTAEARRLEHEADRAALESRFSVHRLSGPGVMLAVDGSDADLKLSAFGYEPPLQPGAGRFFPPADDPDQHSQSRITAVDAAMPAERAFVSGGTRSGKTFFCKQLAYRRLRNGDAVYALDPKDQTEKDPWPRGVTLVGASDDYDEMAEFWDWLDAEKIRRGRRMNRIEQFPFILVFFDEINDCLYERPEFKDRYIRVLRKYAQYRIGIICIGQTDAVDSIGLKGLSQLKQCFDLSLFFRFNRFENQRLSYADYHDGQGRFELHPYRPAAFLPAVCRQHRPENAFKSADSSPEAESKPRPDDRLQIEHRPMSKAESKVFDYIRRNSGQVRRARLLASKCLGKLANAKKYDRVLDGLLESGRLRVRTGGRKSDWVYLCLDEG